MKSSEEIGKTPEQIAQSRIERAIDTNEPHVNLSFLDLTNLPHVIERLDSVTSLDLSFNKLSTLSPQIGQLKSLIYLNLSNNLLEMLPTEMSFLENLRSLNLSFNQFIYVPVEIYQLGQLHEIYLSNNRLSTLMRGISNLSNLFLLDLNSNEIYSIPNEIGQLRKLNSINLSRNRVEEIPEGFWKITCLETLNLAANQIKSISEMIGQLRNLKALNLSANKLTSIPKEIGNLDNLRLLTLAQNNLTNLPKELSELYKLEILTLSSNGLETFPSQIAQLSQLEIVALPKNNIRSIPVEIRGLKKLSYLNLKNNPVSIPSEILNYNTSPEILYQAYFKNKRPLYMTKIVIVGEGSVGKTSIMKRLIQNSYSVSEHKTDGISIEKWEIENYFKFDDQHSHIQINIWDFGGQEIMHATHQFFLTKRSLYLLVLDARLTQEENRVEYWLKMIQSFGGESPVLIIGNKTDQHPLDIDRTGLQRKYPNIVGILETSAATGAGMEILKVEIAKQVGTLPHVRDLLPETWFTIKSKLEELGRENNFITQDEYRSLCSANDVADEISQRTLIGFLHDLGVVLHFQDDPHLESLGILNPQWVTDGVYKILNSHELFQNQGTLTQSLLNKILNLPEYPTNKRLFIVDMMRKFELCYSIDQETYLIPDLLPKDEPYTGEWEGALAFQYHYNILPTSIISRFIVRMNAFVYKTIWRSGVVLKSERNTALVKADTEDRKIYIWISGNVSTRKEFLAVIRAEFASIHKTIAKIEATEKVPIPDAPDAPPVDYEFLLRLEKEGRDFLPVQVGNKIIDLIVEEVLSKIETQRKTEIHIHGNISDANLNVGDHNQLDIGAKMKSKKRKT